MRSQLTMRLTIFFLVGAAFISPAPAADPPVPADDGRALFMDLEGGGGDQAEFAFSAGLVIEQQEPLPSVAIQLEKSPLPLPELGNNPSLRYILLDLKRETLIEGLREDQTQP